MSLPRALFDWIGPFEESLRTGEDVEFCERAIATGATLCLVPRIVVTHHDREHLADFLRCFYRVGLDRVPARQRSPNNRCMPTGVISALLLVLPIGLLMPLQPIIAWWPYDKRAVFSYPLIALAYFAMALGIVAYWWKK